MTSKKKIFLSFFSSLLKQSHTTTLKKLHDLGQKDLNSLENGILNNEFLEKHKVQLNYD